MYHKLSVFIIVKEKAKKGQRGTIVVLYITVSKLSLKTENIEVSLRLSNF